MPRPRTEIGTTGRTTLVAQVNDGGRWITAPNGVKPERWRARTKYRDQDGKLRDVERFAPTKGKAETKLKAALSQRTTPTASTTGTMRADMPLAAAGKVWLSQVNRLDSGLAQRTRDHYAYIFNAHIAQGSIAGHTLREVNRVPVLRVFLQGVADAHGTASAKSTRSVLSRILAMAVGDGVLESNALRDVRPVKQSAQGTLRVRDTTRALTRAERDHLITVADANERAQHLDVSDIVAYMAGIGCRISEALGQHWSDIDLEQGTVHIRGTKTTGSDRVLTLAPWLVQRLQDRAERIGTQGLVFPSPGLSDVTKLRNQRNVARVFREVLDEAGFPWATPHTLRRTVASLIDESGLSIAEAADYLGHKDAAMTARVYLGRKSTTTRAAGVL